MSQKETNNEQLDKMVAAVGNEPEQPTREKLTLLQRFLLRKMLTQMRKTLMTHHETKHVKQARQLITEVDKYFSIPKPHAEGEEEEFYTTEELQTLDTREIRRALIDANDYLEEYIE